MRSLGFIAIVLLAALAGCIASDDVGDIETDQALQENATDQTVPDVPQELRMGTCSEQLGIFPFPEPIETLPDGFEFENLGYVFASTCETSDAAQEAPIAQLHAGIFVTPPDDLANEDAVGHALPFGAFVTDANVKSVFDAWNLGDIDQAEVTVERLVETPAGATGHVLANIGDDTLHMYSQASAPTEGEAGVVRFFGVQDEVVTNAVDMTWTSASALQGQADLVIEGTPMVPPFPPPVAAGIVEHWWGEDYAFEFTYVPLDA